jgi:polar amino acid transport system substrate-binding protein
MCIKIRTLAVALLAVTVAGCGAGGNGSSSGAAPAGAGASTNPAPAVQKDEALAKLVPPDIASDGKIVVGSDASYAPNEFVDTDGTTIIGMDVDLGKAVGQKLGLEVEFQNSAFDGILPGIAAKKYELGMSSFTDNAEREKQVDMVTYFSAGTKLAVPKGNPDGIKIDDLCGKTVAAQRGTVQVDDLTARSDTCTKAGKPAINISQFQAQTDVTLALTAKRAQAMLADSPVVDYAVA